MTPADMLDKLERGRMGHAEAMRFLGVDSYRELVDIVHANGRKMPGHRPMRVSAETMAVFRAALKPKSPPTSS
jgi:hypothetical protein